MSGIDFLPLKCCCGVYGPFEPVPIGEGSIDDEPPEDEPLC